ncbi:hypothetical protein D918_04256 [Trichuris suis]|nr:hypothetical protein D918_04256 [Trichuris suis]
MGAQQTKHEATQQTESEERSPVDREPLFESGQSGTQERSPADTEPLLESGQSGTEERSPADAEPLFESGQSGTEERGETATYLQKILQVCGQKNVLSWKLFKSYQLSSWKKITEGSFSEVFLGRYARHNCCVKIMAIRDVHRPYAEIETTVDDVIPEMMASLELSSIRMSDPCWRSPNLLRICGYVAYISVAVLLLTI